MIYLDLKSITKKELQIENSILTMFYIILLSIFCMYITYMEVNEILSDSHNHLKIASNFYWQRYYLYDGIAISITLTQRREARSSRQIHFLEIISPNLIAAILPLWEI